MTTFKTAMFKRAIASMLAAGATMAAASAMAQTTLVPAPAPVVAPAQNIQAGPVNVQSGPLGTSVTVQPGTGAAIGQRMADNATVRQENRQERIAERQANRENWRMQNFNGRWWYYGPNNQWSIYQNRAWAPYGVVTHPGINPPAVPVAPPVMTNNLTTPAVTNPPAVQSYTYRRGLFGRRYSTGYRGVPTQTAPIQSTTPATSGMQETPVPTLPPATTPPAPSTPAPANGTQP